MTPFEQFVFYPVIVLLAIFLVVLSFQLVIRLVLFIVALLMLWFTLAYLGIVPSPSDWLPEKVQWLHELRQSYIPIDPHAPTSVTQVSFGSKGATAPGCDW